MAEENYAVDDNLTINEVKTYAGGECAVYAYEPTSPLYVFSTNGIKMKDVDLTDMKNLVLVNLTNAGIFEVKLPDSDNDSRYRPLALCQPDANDLYEWQPVVFV